MQIEKAPEKSLLRRFIAVVLMILGLFTFLAPATILGWGFFEKWSDHCEEQMARKYKDEASRRSQTIDIQKIEKDSRELCLAVRQKDLPVVLIFGFIAFCGLILFASGIFVFRGRRKKAMV